MGDDSTTILAPFLLTLTGAAEEALDIAVFSTGNGAFMSPVALVLSDRGEDGLLSTLDLMR